MKTDADYYFMLAQMQRITRFRIDQNFSLKKYHNIINPNVV